MLPTIVSEIVNGDAPVSHWLIFFPVASPPREKERGLWERGCRNRSYGLDGLGVAELGFSPFCSHFANDPVT